MYNKLGMRIVIVNVWKRIGIIAMMSGLALVGARAQYDAAFSHYFDMEPSFNPAVVGKQGLLNVTGVYALGFAGVRHHPRSVYLAGDAPLPLAKGAHGAGLQFVDEKIGVYTHRRIALQYGYKRPWGGGTVSFGVQVGLLNEDLDASKADAEDRGDPALSGGKANGNGLDLGAGVYYLRGTWYVGVSGQHLNRPQVDLGEKAEIRIKQTYYLTAGYNIRLRNPFLKIKTSLLVRGDGQAYRADVTGRLVYQREKKMFYGGVGCSPTNSVTALVGGKFHGVVVEYSYELYTSAIPAGNGGLELFVGYQCPLDFSNKAKNKHKSVRIL